MGCLECTVPSDALALAPTILAVVLTISALGKLRSPGASTEAFRDLRVPGWLTQRFVVAGLPWSEFLLAVGLVLAGGTVGVATAVAALLLFTAYLGLVVRALGFEVPVDCSCFGAFAPGRISRRTVVRNSWFVALAAAALGISRQGSSPLERILDGRLPWWWLLGAAAVAVTVTLVMVGGPEGGRLQAAPAELTVEEGDYLRTRTPAVPVTLGDGSMTTLRQLSAKRAQLLVYVSEGCQSCLETIAAVPRWRQEMPEIDVRLMVALARDMTALTSRSAPSSVHDTDRLVWDSLGIQGTPAVVLLGADGLLAGGPVTGSNAVPTFIEDVKAELLATR